MCERKHGLSWARWVSRHEPRCANTMSLPIKLISTDFDGTLFAEFENPPIPETVQKLIGDLQARGAKWVINTGRDMSSLMEALGRSGIAVEPDYLVLVEREIYCHDESQYLGWRSSTRRRVEGEWASPRSCRPVMRVNGALDLGHCRQSVLRPRSEERRVGKECRS